MAICVRAQPYLALQHLALLHFHGLLAALRLLRSVLQCTRIAACLRVLFHRFHNSHPTQRHPCLCTRRATGGEQLLLTAAVREYLHALEERQQGQGHHGQRHGRGQQEQEQERRQEQHVHEGPDDGASGVDVEGGHDVDGGDSAGTGAVAGAAMEGEGSAGGTGGGVWGQEQQEHQEEHPGHVDVEEQGQDELEGQEEQEEQVVSVERVAYEYTLPVEEETSGDAQGGDRRQQQEWVEQEGSVGGAAGGVRGQEDHQEHADVEQQGQDEPGEHEGQKEQIMSVERVEYEYTLPTAEASGGRGGGQGGDQQQQQLERQHGGDDSGVRQSYRSSREYDWRKEGQDLLPGQGQEGRQEQEEQQVAGWGARGDEPVGEQAAGDGWDMRGDGDGKGGARDGGAEGAGSWEQDGADGEVEERRRGSYGNGDERYGSMAREASRQGGAEEEEEAEKEGRRGSLGGDAAAWEGRSSRKVGGYEHGYGLGAEEGDGGSERLLGGWREAGGGGGEEGSGEQPYGSQAGAPEEGYGEEGQGDGDEGVQGGWGGGEVAEAEGGVAEEGGEGPGQSAVGGVGGGEEWEGRGEAGEEVQQGEEGAVEEEEEAVEFEDAGGGEDQF